MRSLERLLAACLCSLVLFLGSATFLSGETVAQSASQLRENVNANSVTILSGNPNGTYLFIASDISFVLDDGDEMRVLPVVGKGGAQNVRDLLFLRGIDMAIVRSDALKAFSDEPVYGDLGLQLRYITRLYNEEMHLLTRRDITAVDQLDGKRVNVSDVGSGTDLTSRIVFEALGVEPEYVNMSQKDGFEALKNGDVDATILVAGKPSRSWKNLEIDLQKFHLLPIAWTEPLQDVYLPTELTHDDYPNLVAPGEPVDTIAAGAILAAYNWRRGTARYKRLERFVERFFSQIGEFDAPARHPKWGEINLAAELEGWTRFRPAEQWLEANAQRTAESDTAAPAKTGDQDEQRAAFEAFLAERAPDENGDTSALFEQFIEWREAREAQQTAN